MAGFLGNMASNAMSGQLDDMAAGAFKQMKPVTTTAKKNAILDEYCKIIQDNKDEILSVFKESVQKFISEIGTNLDKEKMQEYIDSIIISQINQSILEDYFVNHAFVKHILSDEQIQAVIYDAFHSYTILKKDTAGGEDEDTIDNVVDGIYEDIVKKLKYKPPVKGGKKPKYIVKGGGDKEIADIIKWFPENGKTNINEDIAHIMKQVIQKKLDDKDVHNEIYNVLTQKIEKHIDATIEKLINGGVGLKKTILHYLLTGDKSYGIKRTFEYSIKQILNAAAKPSGSSTAAPDSGELPPPTTITITALKDIKQETIINELQKYFDPHSQDEKVNKTVKQLYEQGGSGNSDTGAGAGTGGKSNSKNVTNKKRKRRVKKLRKTHRRL
jgi:hypothetical protein